MLGKIAFPLCSALVCALLAPHLSAQPIDSPASASTAAENPAYAEVLVSDDSVQLRYMKKGAADLDLEAMETAELGVGLYFNEKRDIVASMNLMAEVSALAWERLSITVGPAAYATLLSLQDTDIFSIGLRTELRYRLLGERGIYIVGRATYAPDILTFGTADRLWDIEGNIELPISKQIRAFAGYRNFEVDLIGPKRELEDSIHVGIRYKF